MTATDTQLDALIAKYRVHETPLTVNFRKLVGGLTSAERATHLLHPYPAKLLMHIPIFFLANSILSKPGDYVLDPFCGSGTVLLESQLAGRPAYGADCNPLARLLSRVKTTPLPSSKLQRGITDLLGRIPSEPKSELPDVVNLRHWFYPHVIDQLHRIADAITVVQDPAMADFFRVCFSTCLRRVSLADPRLTVPVRLKGDQYPCGHWLRAKTEAHIRRLRRVNVQSVFAEILEANALRMTTLQEYDQLPPARVICSDARYLAFEFVRSSPSVHRLPDSSVQLIITSPPYPGAQKYIRSSSLSLGWLRLCSSSQLRGYKGLVIGREEYRKAEYSTPITTGLPPADQRLSKIRKLSPIRSTIAGVYLNEMKVALQEMHRVLRPGGYLVIVAANNTICGRQFQLEDYLHRVAEAIGFVTILRLVDTIRSRGLMTKRNRTAGIIARESVLVFEKKG